MRSPTRRELLGTAAVTGTALLTPPLARAAADRTARRPAPALARGGAFPQGVMAGQPAPHAITLWALHEQPETPGTLELQVATDPEFRRLVHRERLTADPATGIVRRRVLTRRLKADEQHFYRFATRDGASPTGRFKTLPPADSQRPVRVGVFSCQMYFLGYFTGHAALAREEDLDLVVCLGDYVYETYLDGVGPRREPRPEGAEQGARTLTEYRAKYAAYRSDPDLRAMHAQHAFLPVWDDHEVTNDYDGATVDPQRRADAYRAWFEAMPVERPPRTRDRTYRRVRLGRHADLLLLDTRQHRDPAQGTMLGAQQLTWLTEGLARTRTTWKLLGSSVPLMDLDGPGSSSITGVAAGSWQAFPEERAALGEAVLGRGVDGVVALTGDAHAFYAGTVTTTGTTDGRPFATELCAGTLAASNAATSVFEGAAPVSAPALGAIDRANNPHLAFSDASSHGYAVVTAGPQELDVTLRAVSTIQRPQATVRDLARFTVGRDAPGVRER